MLGTLMRFVTEPALLRFELERAGRRGVLFVLAGVAGLFAFAYLLLALKEALRFVMPAALASLLVAACVGLLATGLILAARRPPKRVISVRPIVPPPPQPLPLSLFEAAGRTDRISGLAMAFVAGVLAIRGRR